MAVNLDTVDKPTMPSSDCRSCLRIIRDIDASWRSAASSAAADFADCSQTYSGRATIANPERPNWLIFASAASAMSAPRPGTGRSGLEAGARFIPISRTC
jgi:hypothetical protein